MVNSYMTVNLETTGLNPKTDKVMEIRAIKVVGGQVAGESYTMARPRCQLEEEIVKLTGIRGEILRDVPGIEEIIGQVVAFCEGLPLVGYRTMFDYSFLRWVTVNAGLEFGKEGMGILELCRKFMPEKERKNLGAARRYFRIEAGAIHRALPGVQAANGLYRELMRRHGKDWPEAFEPKTLIYKVKKEQPATERQRRGLHELPKYHRIDIAVQMNYLSRDEIFRMMDKIVSEYGRTVKR